MLDRVLSVIAPHSCCGCGKIGASLCDSCKNDITSELFAQCLSCLAPTSSDNLCSQCGSTTPWDGAWCVSERDSGLAALLDNVKFNSNRDGLRACADLLHETLPLLPADICLVPVPTAAAHRRERGFDHTAVIVKRLARLRTLPYQYSLGRLTNDTQHFKNRHERIRSALSAYQVRGMPPHKVMLIDDIYTTGATLTACAAALKSAGTNEVYVAVLARQIPK